MKHNNRKEARQLEGMLKELTSMQRTALTESGVENYQTAMDQLQARYHKITGNYYHISKELKGGRQND